MARKTKYKWQKGRERWDLVLAGDPDCFAYMIRCQGKVWRDYIAWCWSLTTPRGSQGQRFSGWAPSAFEAKLQVEAEIRRRWA